MLKGCGGRDHLKLCNGQCLSLPTPVLPTQKFSGLNHQSSWNKLSPLNVKISQSDIARMDLKLLFNQPRFGHQRKDEPISPDQSEIVAGKEKNRIRSECATSTGQC